MSNSQKKVTKYQDDANDNGDDGYMKSLNGPFYAEVSNDNNKPKPEFSNPPKFCNLSDDETLKIIAEEVKTGFSSIPNGQHRKWLRNKFTKYYGSVLPTSLIELWTSYFFNGDSGMSVDVKPEWLDIEKFQRGQKFAVDQLVGIFYADLISLFTFFSFEDGLKPLIFSNGSSTPYTAFKRYLSTISRLQNWYTSDPWTRDTPAYNDICKVRQMHATVRKNIDNTSHDEYEKKTVIKQAWCPELSGTRLDCQSSSTAPKTGQCPYTAIQHLPELMKIIPKINQGHMSETQFAFVGIIVLYPKFFGVHSATDDDLEAFCHVWRGIGYLLGIDDEFNFCRGTLEEVRTRARNFLEYWVKPNLRTASPEWEHMMRCVITGVRYYFPLLSYHICLLDFAKIMNLQMPRIENSSSYLSWVGRRVIRFYFDHGSKLPVLRIIMNKLLNIALKRARKFDKQKHEKLKIKSAKTIACCNGKSKTIINDKNFKIIAWTFLSLIVDADCKLLLAYK